VPPARFIAIAEAHQLIGDIGQHVLRTSLRDLVEWRDQLGDAAPDYVSVNVSMVELTQAKFCERVRQTLDEFGLKGSALCLELTETVLMAESGLVVEEVRRLRDMGVRVAIDDFGTGYSSLAYLTRLPVTTLKVDQSFVAELGTGEGDSLVAAVVGIAKTLGLTVVAEGVETHLQADSLRGLGCAHAQGYLFSRPVPNAQLKALLEKDGRNGGDGDQDADLG
jgi:EAL domain-containing protein (putative c-di-GMP-specific phosphodiesterase class I)